MYQKVKKRRNPITGEPIVAINPLNKTKLSDFELDKYMNDIWGVY